MADPVAAARVPWIGALWDLIDLQIDQRTGKVSGSLFENGGLQLREGDTFRLAVLFFNGTGTAVNPSPSRLRWTLRDAANLELVSSVTLDAPAAANDQPDPYFVLQPNIARLGAAALDLLEGQDALPCVADLDWTIGGKSYSSDTFPVSVEFGLSVKQAATNPTASVQTAPQTSISSGPSSQPVVVPAPGLTAEDVARIFESLWQAKFPPGEGFAYVRNAEVDVLVPGGDCTTGQTWTPT